MAHSPRYLDAVANSHSIDRLPVHHRSNHKQSGFFWLDNCSGPTMKFTTATSLLAILAAVANFSEAAATSTDANKEVPGADTVVTTSLDSSASSSVLSAKDMHRLLPGSDSSEDEADEGEEEEEEGGEEEEEDVDEEEQDAYQAVEDEEENEMTMSYVAGAAGSATVIFAALGVLEHRRRIRVKKTPTIDLNDNIQTNYVSAANIEIV